MYVRVKVGRYAGEVRDVISEAALVMVADGRAEYPDAAPVVVAEVPTPRRRRGSEGSK